MVATFGSAIEICVVMANLAGNSQQVFRDHKLTQVFFQLRHFSHCFVKATAHRQFNFDMHCININVRK